MKSVLVSPYHLWYQKMQYPAYKNTSIIRYIIVSGNQILISHTRARARTHQPIFKTLVLIMSYAPLSSPHSSLLVNLLQYRNMATSNKNTLLSNEIHGWFRISTNTLHISPNIFNQPSFPERPLQA